MDPAQEKSISISEISRLQDILKRAATFSPSRNLIMHPSGKTTAPTKVAYSTLYVHARQRCSLIQGLDGFSPGNPILIHLEDQLEFILWFWSVLLADGLPVASSPLSLDLDHRQKHLLHLSDLLGSPLCITSERHHDLFHGSHGLRLHDVESLVDGLEPLSGSDAASPSGSVDARRPAMLMLTSGSSGNAKAVCLTHKQILAAVAGKAAIRQLPVGTSFLNWIGLDHVASLVEIHIHALYHGLDQVHVHPHDIVSSPLAFLDLLSQRKEWDLSSLTVLTSGGEANVVETCVAASALLRTYGAPDNVITPGFGMTETCAGAIFNLQCPQYDAGNELVFASVGRCMEGIEMRVASSSSNGSSTKIAPQTSGELEIRGDVVFERYYRNEEATASAFTPDGWFRTGDQAIVDSSGNLSLIGRTSDTININGIKFSCLDIEQSLKRNLATRITRTVVFPTRATAAQTETLTVAFVPKHWPMLGIDIAEVCDEATKSCVVWTGCRPLIFALLDESVLPISALGKISRAKMRSLFEKGAFDASTASFNEAIQNYRSQALSVPQSEAEAYILNDVAEVMGVEPHAISLDTPFFNVGCTSMDLIRLKHRIDGRLQIHLPIITIMHNPTVRSLASFLRDNQPTNASNATVPTSTYDPVVVFQATGSKTPLWLFHPGVGEVLVFVGLAKQLEGEDRPVYALRARGFEPGQRPFGTLDEVLDTYEASIRKRQPIGPYALAGYSYGSMLAFEVAKRLEHRGESVKFLASFNLPPHIKLRMRQLDWNSCLLHLAYFLGLITEEYAEAMEQRFSKLSHLDAMAQILNAVDHMRMMELGLEEEGIKNWASLAYSLQSMAVNYEPTGKINAIDIFHAIPLKGAARSRSDWVENHLARWAEFSATRPKFYEVKGAHYTMIGPDHVVGFSQILKDVLKDRDV
ncbi:acetyl-CoA synthetase-like protein [Apiospora aurea]|uniref:Acetyl-CoA synthetase-like protein n=1 Tax=Apiospora aurea TaxID=335848 RepID=A0ABR1Q3E2_9PEZI